MLSATERLLVGSSCSLLSLIFLCLLGITFSRRLTIEQDCLISILTPSQGGCTHIYIKNKGFWCWHHGDASIRIWLVVMGVGGGMFWPKATYGHWPFRPWVGALWGVKMTRWQYWCGHWSSPGSSGIVMPWTWPQSALKARFYCHQRAHGCKRRHGKKIRANGNFRDKVPGLELHINCNREGADDFGSIRYYCIGGNELILDLEFSEPGETSLVVLIFPKS